MTPDWIKALANSVSRSVLGANHPEILEAKRKALQGVEDELLRRAGPLPTIDPSMLEVGK